MHAGTLSTLPELASAAKIPSLIVVGEVVPLHETLAWFGGETQSLEEQEIVGEKAEPIAAYQTALIEAMPWAPWRRAVDRSSNRMPPSA